MIYSLGSLHSLETTLHSQQQTYLRPSIHTTHNFKWSWYTLTTLHISQLHTFISSSRQHIHALQNSWQGHTTLHAVHHILPHSVLTGDVDAHSTFWHSYTDDHRGQLIADGRQAQHTKGQDAQQLQAFTRPLSMQNNSKKQHTESKHLWSSSQTLKWGDNFWHTKT